MALNTKDKKRIEEEEEYRQQLREQDTYRKEIRGSSSKELEPKKKSSKWLWIVLIVFILPVGLYASQSANQSQKQADNAPTPTISIITNKGSYTSYDGTTYAFDITTQAGENKYVASFQPFLPQDDKNLLEGALQAMKTSYGNTAQINPQPELVERNGTNVMRFNADYGYYYVLPIKQDTGEVHSLVFWKE